jgi:hypothetical protein
MYNDSRSIALDYWTQQPTDQPWLVNGFKGTWAFSDHSLIPDVILEFLLETFRDRLGELRKGHVKSIPLNEINDLLNSVWEGPGSVVKLVNLTYDMRSNRFSTISNDAKDPLKGYDTPTIESDLGEKSLDRLED